MSKWGQNQWGNAQGKGKGKGIAAVLELLGMMYQGGAQSGGGGGGGGAGGAASQNWKGELQAALQKSMGTVAKGAVTYSTTDSTDDGSKKPRFQAIAFVSGESYTGLPADSKKVAEQNAAKAAVKKMFPQHTHAVVAPSTTVSHHSAPGSTKRKAEEMQAELPSKSKLIQGVHLIVQRPLTKEDMVYQTEEVVGQEQKFSGSVTITATGQTFASDRPAGSRKDAEHAAAEVALKALEAQFAPLQEEQKAKKARKNKEGIEKLKEAMKAKKEAKGVVAPS